MVKGHHNNTTTTSTTHTLTNGLQQTGKQPTISLYTGVEADTGDKYIIEWELYIDFCRRKGFKIIPGRDVDFDIALMQKYLEWRSKRNNINSIAGIKSKLKH